MMERAERALREAELRARPRRPLAPGGVVNAGWGVAEVGAGKFKKVKKVDDEVFYNKKLIQFNSLGLSGKKTEGEVGLEIECEGKNLCTDFLHTWTVTTDGSLRAVDGHQPYEYYFRRPLKREAVGPALKLFHRKQMANRAEFKMSHRTSVHAHINVQQMTMKEILTYICLYLLFESALTQFAGEDREGNLFCQRAKDAEHWVWTLVQAYKTGNFNQIYRDEFRYTACNTASLGHLGSLEFRALRGTTDSQLIENWVDLLLHLRDESRNFTNPMDLLERYYLLGNNDFFRMVFSTRPDLEQILSQACQTIDLGMKEGSYFVRDLAMAVEEWKAPKAKEKPSPLEEVREDVNDPLQEPDQFLEIIDEFENNEEDEF